MRLRVKRFMSNSEAATSIEYALIASIVGLACVVALPNVTTEISNQLQGVIVGFQAALN